MMNKIKNIKIKDIILCTLFVLIGVLTVGSIGASATSLITSREVSFNNTGTGMDSSNVQDAIDELYINNDCANASSSSSSSSSTGTNFGVGDYISMTPTLSSYTTEPKYTGSSTTQTINPKELKLWRVIRVNSDGTYDAVSEYVSSTNVTFQGKTGYQSFVGYLNILASKYENRKYTVGSRIMGYNGQTEFISDTSYFDGTDLKVGTEWTSLTSGTPAEEYLGRGDELYTTDYELVKAAYGGTADSYAKANKVRTSTATYYWLGSRFYVYISSTVFAFTGRHVLTNGSVDGIYLRRSNGGYWDDGSFGYALRPIITLRGGLTAASGSGTKASPYVLN